MKINVDYYYIQEYLPTSRHRKIRHREAKNTIEVEIKELSTKEFPVAFVVHDYQSVQENMKSYEDYDGDKCEYRMTEELIRTYNGKLYKPVRITHGAAISTLFESSDYVKENLERHFQYFWNTGEDFSDRSIIIRDNLEERKTELIKCANNYIYCNYAFWVECGEPRYVINTFGLGHNHGGTGLFIEWHYNPNIPNRNYFNALERDAAIAYGKSIAARRGDTDSIKSIGKHNYIEVCMPEMVKVRPSEQHGNGNAFINNMEDIIQVSEDSFTAGLLCLATLIK